MVELLSTVEHTQLFCQVLNLVVALLVLVRVLRCHAPQCSLGFCYGLLFLQSGDLLCQSLDGFVATPFCNVGHTRAPTDVPLEGACLRSLQGQTLQRNPFFDVGSDVGAGRVITEIAGGLRNRWEFRVRA